MNSDEVALKKMPLTLLCLATFFRETTITTRNMILQQGWPHFAEDKTCLCHQSDFWQKIRHKLKQYAKKCGECISRFLSS